MGLIISSLIICGLGVFIFLTSVNFAWILWEKEKVDDLTKQIKPREEDSLFRRNQHRGYTQSFDIKSISKTSISKARGAYEKTLVAITDKEYPSWVTKVAEAFGHLKKDFFASIKTFFNYLVHLARPEESGIVDTEIEDVEIDKTIQKVKDNSQQSSDVTQNSIDEDAYSTHSSDIHIDATSPIQVKINESRELAAATINMTSSLKTKSISSEAFEKLESRILDKLKQSGLNHYQVWLELGELYLKFNEKEKASEIFALVLKNTKNEKEKEVARNHLIGI